MVVGISSFANTGDCTSTPGGFARLNFGVLQWIRSVKVTLKTNFKSIKIIFIEVDSWQHEMKVAHSEFVEKVREFANESKQLKEENKRLNNEITMLKHQNQEMSMDVTTLKDNITEIIASNEESLRQLANEILLVKKIANQNVRKLYSDHEYEYFKVAVAKGIQLTEGKVNFQSFNNVHQTYILVFAGI